MAANPLLQLLPLLIIGLALVPPYWKIFERSGWHPALSLLMVVPFVNLILLWVVAFKKWPSDNISGTFN